jgi:hypothetical protein
MAPLFTEQWSHAPLFQKITMRSSIFAASPFLQLGSKNQ